MPWFVGCLAILAGLGIAGISVEAAAQYGAPQCQPGAPGCADPYRGEAFRGAARGAARGAVIGGITGDVGRGAARGAAIGGMFGAARRAASRY